MSLFAIPAERSDVLLVSMPFGILDKPSIGLGLIKAHLGLLNIPSRVLYFTLPFAQIIGVPLYTLISGGEPATVDQLGEWLFSVELFPDTPPSDAYISEVLEGASIHHRGGNPVVGKRISQEFIHDGVQKLFDDFVTLSYIMIVFLRSSAPSVVAEVAWTPCGEPLRSTQVAVSCAGAS
jgi:hypothetical protein